MSLDTTSGIRLHLDRTLSTQCTGFLPAADEEVSSGSALAQQSSQVPQRPWARACPSGVAPACQEKSSWAPCPFTAYLPFIMKALRSVRQCRGGVSTEGPQHVQAPSSTSTRSQCGF